MIDAHKQSRALQELHEVTSQRLLSISLGGWGFQKPLLTNEILYTPCIIPTKPPHDPLLSHNLNSFKGGCIGDHVGE